MRNDDSQPIRLSYLDFELEIGPRENDKYSVAVVKSPAGEARTTMLFPFTDTALERRLDKLQIALLRSGGKRRDVPSEEEQAVQEFGQELFKALFTGDVYSLYVTSRQHADNHIKGLRLKLRILAPEIAALPWEFLFDPSRGDYVCLSARTPVIRYLELLQPSTPLTVKPPLRILGMVASPRDLVKLDIAGEKRQVEEALKKLQARGLVELTWLPGQTWRDLQQTMQGGGPWHIFHFIGHAGFDRRDDQGFIVLADEAGEADRLSARKLARLLDGHAALRLVLLNACEGGHVGKRDIFTSTAATLIRQGLPAVLAMQYEITDQAALEFARSFYSAIADGLPIDTSVVSARKAISIAIPNTIEWGTPVLYMRSPDGLLFNIEGQKERLAQEKADAERLAQQKTEEAHAMWEKAQRERLNRKKLKLKAEQERLAQEKAEAERLAKQKAAAEALAREQAEQKRLAQMELVQKAAAEVLARKQAEQAERERLAREQAERLAKQKAAAEALAREQAEQAERERLAREQAELLAKQKAAAEVLAREQAKRELLAREQQAAAEEKARRKKQSTFRRLVLLVILGMSAISLVCGFIIEEILYGGLLGAKVSQTPVLRPTLTHAPIPVSRTPPPSPTLTATSRPPSPTPTVADTLKPQVTPPATNTPVIAFDPTQLRPIATLIGVGQSYGIAWSPDGTRLVMSQSDGIWTWEVGEAQPSQLLREPQCYACGLAWSSDGQWLAAGLPNSTIGVWKMPSGERVLTLKGHTKQVSSLAWSNDGKFLASGSNDNDIRIWEISSGKMLHPLTGHTGSVNSVMWSPDDRRLASGSNDGTVKIWDVASGETLFTLTEHTGDVLTVAWASNGNRLASGSYDHTVRVWDTTNGTELVQMPGHGGAVYSVAWLDDDQWLASGSSDSLVRIWDVSNGNRIWTSTGHHHQDSVYRLAWSPQSLKLASMDLDGVIIIWGIP